jgi:hypothetical protein
VICIAEFLCQQLQTQLAASSATTHDASALGTADSSTGNRLSLQEINADLVNNVKPESARKKRTDLKNVIRSLHAHGS